MAELIRPLTSKVDRSVLKRTLSSSRTVVLSKAWLGPEGLKPLRRGEETKPAYPNWHNITAILLTHCLEDDLRIVQ